MTPFILVWEQSGYAEEGGGTYFEDFCTLDELDNRVNELANELKERFTIVLAGRLMEEYKYKSVEIITKLKRQ